MKILTFSSLYPNNVDPTHGIFVERRLLELIHATGFEANVVSPVPWFPFRNAVFGSYADMARINKTDLRSGVKIGRPRFPLLPKIGMNAAASLMAMGSESCVRRVNEESGPFDLLDAHYFYPDGVAASLIAKKLRMPLLITARGSDINLIAQFDSPRRQILEAADYAHAVIAVSKDLAEKMVSIGIKPEKIVVLRNGVDLEFFCPGDKLAERRDLDLGNTVLLSVGALKRAKGHSLAMDFLSRMPNAQLVIAGKGPDESYFRNYAATLGLVDRVRFTGSIDSQTLRKYYRASSALLLMSEREGMPNVILESLACGTPVIATRVGGIPELINTPAAGRLVGKNTADAVLGAWSEINNASIREDAVRNVALQFSWDRTVEGLADVMRQAVN